MITPDAVAEAVQDLDPMRKLIHQVSRKRGFTLADLSLSLGRNKTYIQQYIWRRTPKVLSLEDRQALTKTLDLLVGLLMEDTPTERMLEFMSNVGKTQHEPRPTVTGTAPHGQMVPAYVDTDAIDGAAKEMVSASIASPSVQMAIWLTAPSHPRLGAGDLVYLEGRQPPRTSDIVVVIADHKVAAAGELSVSTHDSVSVDVGAGVLKTFERADIRVHKVCAIVYS